MRFSTSCLALLGVGLLTACRACPEDAQRRPAEQPLVKLASAQSAAASASAPAPSESTSATPEPGLAPLQSASPIVALEVKGFHNAAVALPVGATTPRPVIVSVHGNDDRPEEHCDVWRTITGGAVFVLCPRGIPRPDAPRSEDRWTYGWNGRDLEREINAGVAALRVAWEGYVDPGPMIYAGFSLGAILGADIVLWNPARFPRAVLIEGGTTNWSLGSAKEFRKAGGNRVLFACGQPDCVKETQAGLHWLEAAKVPARTAFEGTVGHTYDGPVADGIVRAWTWLTEGDPRWPPAASYDADE